MPLFFKRYKLENQPNIRKYNINICGFAEKSLNPILKDYELFAVCIHSGDSLINGHYTSMNYLFPQKLIFVVH